MSKSVFTELLSVSYPSLPFFTFVPEGVCVGTVIYIEGYIPKNSAEFLIDLIDGQNIDEQTSKQADIPLGIRIRFDKQLLVRNTRRDGDWGHEEKDGFLAIDKGDSFQMKIIVEEKRYLLIFNGIEFEYQHRMSSDRAKLIRIEGGVHLHRIEFRHGNHYHCNQLNYYENEQNLT